MKPFILFYVDLYSTMMENYILYYNIAFYIILCYMKILNDMKIKYCIKELIV